MCRSRKRPPYISCSNLSWTSTCLLRDPQASFVIPRSLLLLLPMQELHMPFQELLQRNKLDLILPLFYETQTSQGYGYLEEVPTYYGIA